jgi:hypothetical protein
VSGDDAFDLEVDDGSLAGAPAVQQRGTDPARDRHRAESQR